MHAGLFRNYTGGLNVSNLTLQGNVSNTYSGSGFLICGTLGDVDGSTALTANGIVLDGALINENTAESGYAPLLINNIGVNTTLSMTGVQTSASGYADLVGAAATSLIGDVGSETAANINLSFSNIALDARKAALAEAEADAALTAAYGTDKSIFSRATLLNSFQYNRDSSGAYNYTVDEDYPASGTQHRVTYGHEVTGSTEFSGREKQIQWQQQPARLPISIQSRQPCQRGVRVYLRRGHFLRYVYQPRSEGYHELRVNVAAASIDEGCGKYNDPYTITDGAQLVTFANIISGDTSMFVSAEIILPADISGTNMWCEDPETDVKYTFNGTNFVADGKPNKSLNDVRKYLAGAYYAISENITIPSEFCRLGNISGTDGSYSNAYAFRGVIVGNGNTVVNQSTALADQKLQRRGCEGPHRRRAVDDQPQPDCQPPPSGMTTPPTPVSATARWSARSWAATPLLTAWASALRTRPYLSAAAMPASSPWAAMSGRFWSTAAVIFRNYGRALAKHLPAHPGRLRRCGG
jgi:hypothetical protein